MQMLPLFPMLIEMYFVNAMWFVKMTIHLFYFNYSFILMRFYILLLYYLIIVTTRFTKESIFV